MEFGYAKAETKIPRGVKIQKNANNFNKLNNYKMTVKFNSFSGDIITSINDIIVFKTNDKSLKGNKIGIICDGIGAIFTQILPEQLL